MILRKDKFRYFRQLESIDCGPTCLRMLCYYYGREYDMEDLRAACHTTRIGVNLGGIQKGAESLGFATLALSLTYEQLLEHDIPLPCVLHWKENHFVLLLEIRKKNGGRYFRIADPAFKVITLNEERFLKAWKGHQEEGVLLALEPGEEFYRVDPEEEEKPQRPPVTDRHFLSKYGRKFAPSLMKLLLLLIMVGGLNLLIPILTQKMVDQGISYQNIHFVYLVLISQIVVFLGVVVLDLIKGWLMLHVNTRISVTMTSDFLRKLFRLPVFYFDSKWAGDLLHRVGDNRRIEHFLTSSLIGVVFSLVNFIAFSYILLYYSPPILMLFALGSFLSVFWILSFMKRRETLDYNKFEIRSEDTGNLIETIAGMPEIKLNGAEDLKRFEWEKIQAKLFDVNLKELALEQYQYLGNSFFMQMKNLLISFIAAKQVIDGEITLGMMLSISYIIGQMNGPLAQLIDFFQTGQDARISLARLREVYKKENEDEQLQGLSPAEALYAGGGSLNGFGTIDIRDLKFSYSGFEDDLLFEGLNLCIPEGKVTAVVGPSGSGKTTLMKLLLKFYPHQGGDIYLGTENMEQVSTKFWRSQCGVVMQEGYIFSDTIARNIALSTEKVDQERVRFAARMANIHQFIDTLPQTYRTKVGNTGVGLSKGQQQRILIARAIYKDPRIIFFDEATSALDANNEKVILENLNQFFCGRTVLVIAHRLSTVKNADQIIVLQDGKIIETGSHKTLTRQKGIYFELVRNQLELGN